ncbi:MAG: PEP-CTERM sorting domain-containing protein [Verrucomicrobiota bacterium]|nr:PEP-CTERM sorting domain-containing protein [Verrucomicrobiota bacterium]
MKTRNVQLWVLALAATGFVSAANVVQAGAGIFGSDIGLKINGGNNTFYELSLLGDGRHAPIASGTVTLPVDLVATGFDGLNLGTFNINTDSLLVIGGGVLTFKNDGTNVTSATVAYSVDGGPFQFLNLGFNEDNVNGALGDQRWASTDASVDILTGLANGVHTLSAYTFASTENPTDTIFDSQNGANYNATFTVVPEPTTWAMLVSGLGILVGFQRRRRRLS